MHFSFYLNYVGCKVIFSALTSLIFAFVTAFPFLIGRIRTIETTSNELEIITFPFLIGRIRTVDIVVLQFPFSKFPFLIGRIRTFLLVLKRYQTLSFPFLIGRIRTNREQKLDNTFKSFHSS